MKKTTEKMIQQFQDNKACVKHMIGSALDNAKSFVDDHSEGIMYTIIYGGSAIIFGQTIHYMHLLNKAAKNGRFFTGNIR